MMVGLLSRSGRAALPAAALLVLGAAGACARDDGPDNAELLSTALANAMESAQNAFTVPAAVDFGRTAEEGRLGTAPAAIKALPDEAVLRAQRVAGRNLLAKTMTGTALARNTTTMNQWLDAQEDGTDDPDFRPLGGGVSDVRLTTMNVDDTQASVTAEVDEWAAMAQIGEDGGAEISRPTSTVLVKAHLVQKDGSWLVDDYTWEFAPGSGP